MQKLIKGETLKAAKIALEMGYIVIVRPDTGYFFYSDGKRIGYMQYDGVGGISYSLNYKPSGYCGTGARFYPDDERYPKPFPGHKKCLKDCLAWNPYTLTHGKETYWKDVNEFLLKQWSLEKLVVFVGDKRYKAKDYKYVK